MEEEELMVHKVTPELFFQWRQQINLIYETGYTISLVAILLSLGILGYFK